MVRPMRGVGWPLLWLAIAGCAGLKNGYYVKDEVRYRVAALDPAVWKPVGFSDNDLAWARRDGGQLLAMNATCRNFGDPSLEVLTQHLLMGFTDREQKSQQPRTIDGRDALVSRYQAKLDGVEVELMLAVLKKNDCVHDFSYLAPRGHFDEAAPDFEKLIDDFTAERTP